MNKNKSAFTKKSGEPLISFLPVLVKNYDKISELDTNNHILHAYTSDGNTITESEEPYYNKSEMFEHVHPDDVNEARDLFYSVQHLISTPSVEEHTFELRIGSDETYRWKRYVIKSMPSDIKKKHNVILILEKDIDEQKRAQTERDKEFAYLTQELERVRNLKNSFTSRVSHEIRTPLNAIIGYMAIAKNKADDPARMLDCVTKSETASKYLLSIINDILDLSSIETGRIVLTKRSFDLKALLNTLGTMFNATASQKDIDFSLSVEELNHEYIIGDKFRLNQILMNLLSNAIRFTGEGGSVSLIVRQIETTANRVKLRFTVSDTAGGMDKQTQDVLFQPYGLPMTSQNSEREVSGVGLAITRSLIDLMQGQIEVQTHEGVGTEIFIELEFEYDEANSVKPAKETVFKGKRTLVVDDRPNSCEYLRLLLMRCGLKCDTAYDGTTAVRAVKDALELGNGYELCLIDWDMPDIDGVETTRRMRMNGLPDSVPVVMVTAYDTSQITEEAKAAGIVKILPKPIFQSTLFNMLLEISGSYTPETSSKHYDFSSKNILLAEDNIMNTEIAKALLEDNGFSVDTANNGKLAVEMFVSSPEFLYDAILMDIRMPEADGFEATALIRNSEHPQAKTIPIFAMTADTLDEDIEAAKKAGMNEHIAKPISAEELFSKLAKALSKK